MRRYEKIRRRELEEKMEDGHKRRRGRVRQVGG